jgi:hypothetical protein
MKELTHFIGDNHVRGTSGRFGEGSEPMTGEAISRVPLASKAEVRAAVENAIAAQPTCAARFGYLWHEWIGERWRPIAPGFARPNPAEWSDNRITAAWLGHATVLINFFGIKILTDPVLFPRIGIRLPGLTVRPKRLTAPNGSTAWTAHHCAYRKTHMDSFWKLEKRLYAHAPQTIQRLVSAGYIAVFRLAKLATGSSFREYVANCGSSRGMNFYHDVCLSLYLAITLKKAPSSVAATATRTRCCLLLIVKTNKSAPSMLMV